MAERRHHRPRRHPIGGSGLPKGTHLLPTGGYQLPGSASVFRDHHGKARAIRVSPVVRDEFDVKRFTSVVRPVPSDSAVSVIVMPAASNSSAWSRSTVVRWW